MIDSYGNNSVLKNLDRLSNNDIKNILFSQNESEKFLVPSFSYQILSVEKFGIDDGDKDYTDNSEGNF